ncbi:MAG: hypothetical protein J0M25_07450 [Flavobacteriales bacterium]|nr:hypothetical protein [Flavobacteriales bacterium]
MKNSNFLYIRGLRNVEHSIFAVGSSDQNGNGQKYYTDPQFGRRQAYSSGQQVKRSIIESFNLPFAAITFNWEIDKNEKASMLEPHSPCDPSFVDQLLGGYMKAEKDTMTIKRRSPLSISAMRPLHPLLGGLERDNEGEATSFDRSSMGSQHNVNVYIKDDKGKRTLIDPSKLEEWLTTKERSLGAKYYNPKKSPRVTGLFVYDVAIDLRRLFTVSINKLEPEISSLIEDKLRREGWIEHTNIFGKCLLCPQQLRDKIIPALAHGLINWRITSNQARTFSLMETLAVAISDNANKLAGSIRAKLSEDTEKQRAIPLLDDTAGANIYIALPCDGYIVGASGTANALEDAEKYIIEQLQSYDYENQK